MMASSPQSSKSSDDDNDIEEGDLMDMDEDDSKINETIQTLDKQIAETPNDYDAHTQLIWNLRKIGDLERLRGARQAMASLFPLTPGLWTEWIEDEKSLSSPQEIKKLFKTATEDYLSLEVWLEYCQWSLGVGDVEESRKVFEEAVSVCGLHVKQGSVIWDVYREFEISIHSLYQGQDNMPEKEKLDQRERVLELFRRQLGIPLMGMEDTWGEYLEFLDPESPSEDILAAYKSAKAQLTHLIPFEEALEASKGQTASAYHSYLDHERKEKSKNPARIKNLFERAITDNCLDEDFWLEYLGWMDRYLRRHEEILPAYARAVRNCDWSAPIWQRYLLAMERAGSEFEVIDSIFPQAVRLGLGDTSTGIHLWLTYIYMVQRRERKIAEEAGCPVNYDLVSKAFAKGKESLMEAFQIPWDRECYYRKSWAYFEASRRNNMELARKLWREEIMPQGNGPYASFWLEYFELERQFGGEESIQNCRRLLTMAVNSVTDFVDSICQKFLQFEREEGSLAELDIAQQKVESRLKQVAAQAKSRSKFNWVSNRQGQDSSKKYDKKRPPAAERSEINKKSEPSGTKKRRADDLKSSPKSSQPPSKFQRDTDGFAVPASFPPPATHPKAADSSKKKVVTFADQSSRSSSSADASKKPAIDTSKYDRTVFVANLKFSIDEERLKIIFSPLGAIAETRIVRQAGNRSRGFGFVEFKAPDAVEKALEMDRTPVDGRPMFVSKAEDKEKHPTQFPYAINLEKNKLFVKNIAKNVTEEELKKLFGAQGKLRQLRLITRKDGSPKGIAFVEFADETAASEALMKTDGVLVGGQEIHVAISNPPPKPDFQAFPSTASGPRISHSSKLQLTPRALQASKKRGGGPAVSRPAEKAPTMKKEEQNGTGGTPSASTVQKAKLSNEQFRNMFLKKD